MTIPYEASTTFPAEPAAPALVRAWSIEHVRKGFSSDADEVLLEDTALIVSELITNAIRAGCAHGRIDLLIDDDYLRISVLDDAPGQVQRRRATPDDVHGRGLAIVAALSRDWGVTTSPLGKAVWAEIDFVRPEI